MKFLKINSRIKLLTTLSLVTYIFLVMSYFGSNIEDYKMGYQEGANAAHSNTGINTFYLKVTPKDNVLNFPFNLENKNTNEQVSFRPSLMKVHVTDGIKKSKKVKTEETLILILSLSLLIIFFYIPFAIRELLKSLRNGNFFRYENQQNFRRTGKIFGVAFFITLAADIINYDINKTLFSFTEFNITREMPSFIWLICGLLFLIFAEVLRSGIAIKDENELTV